MIFFVYLLTVACSSPEETGIKIRWHEKRAVALSIPGQLLGPISANSMGQQLSVRLANRETAILGSFRQESDEVIFTPLIPFTRGLQYSVWLNGKRVGDTSIPTLEADDKPELLAIYPLQDSLPENQLKIYLYFSRPMREGQSQKYVSLVKNEADTLPGVFLNLQPELWNAERTILTLWLDPGRIKRDLQPNKKLGTPLQAGNHYQIVVSDAWPDQQGATLRKSTTKVFVTTARDSLSPKPVKWKVHAPLNRLKPLDVSFGEPFDHGMLTETLHVFTEKGSVVKGKWQLQDEERKANFTPAGGWTSGTYILRIESRLEDLAGNNLNRPFDRDLTRNDGSLTAEPFIDIHFSVLNTPP
ncbi:hypothetical protein CWM47_03155 [Spirosoma pollinicola]|uniref:SbsA Ig-like domain-containing protein n=1 Tax=Spirosoma pollinicola TaxID=2057025 RepID=A0A2K8ZBB8_9BACT|nr:hypothetical protein CWM47_03155 [Spirosoma pollinicola]